MKKKYLKNSIILFLYYINNLLFLINIMLIAELNKCYLFYIISASIILINNKIIKIYCNRKLKKELIIF